MDQIKKLIYMNSHGSLFIFLRIHYQFSNLLTKTFQNNLHQKNHFYPCKLIFWITTLFNLTKEFVTNKYVLSKISKNTWEIIIHITIGNQMTWFKEPWDLKLIKNVLYSFKISYTQIFINIFVVKTNPNVCRLN